MYMYIFICIKSCAFYALKYFYIIGVFPSTAGVILLEDEITPSSVHISGNPFRLPPVSCCIISVVFESFLALGLKVSQTR